MAKIIRNVAAIDPADRRAIERLLGSDLDDGQRLVISVLPVEAAGSDDSAALSIPDVPPWWNVFEGLAPQDVDILDESILARADFSRDAG